MKQCYFLFFFLFITSSLFSQDYKIDWRQCFGTPTWDEGDDIVKVADGFLLVGLSEQRDIWLIKTDFDGNLLWERKYGGSNDDVASRILETTDNHYYIIGTSQSSDGDISNDPYPNSGDSWILKIDGTGNIIWDRIFGGNGTGIGRDITMNGCLSPDGGVVVSVCTNSIDGDVTHYFGSFDIWIYKLNGSGDHVWSTFIGGSYFDSPYVITATSDDGYLIGALTYPDLSTGGNLNCQGSNGSGQASIFKIDSLGNLEWQQCYGGSEHDAISDILEIENGYLLAGFGSSSDGDLINSNYHQGYYTTGTPTPDIWLLMVDLTGNLIWQHCYGGTDADFSNKIFKTNKGYKIFGNTHSSNGDVIDNHSWNAAYSDIWMIEVDSVGNLLSSQCFGHTGGEEIMHGVIKKTDSQYLITGMTGSTHWYCAEEFDITLFQITDTLVDASKDILLDKILNVTPNPANEFIIFESRSTEVIKVEIYDLLGIRHDELIIPGNAEAKLLLDNKKSGLYFFKCTLRGAQYTGKFIVNHS